MGLSSFGNFITFIERERESRKADFFLGGNRQIFKIWNVCCPTLLDYLFAYVKHLLFDPLAHKLLRQYYQDR